MKDILWAIADVLALTLRYSDRLALDYVGLAQQPACYCSANSASIIFTFTESL